jgi:hypothetical protein
VLSFTQWDFPIFDLHGSLIPLFSALPFFDICVPCSTCCPLAVYHPLPPSSLHASHHACVQLDPASGSLPDLCMATMLGGSAEMLPPRPVLSSFDEGMSSPSVTIPDCFVNLFLSRHTTRRVAHEGSTLACAAASPLLRLD